MTHRLVCRVVWLSCLVLFPSVTLAQFGGSRAGVEPNASNVNGLPTLSRDVAESFITIDGRAEVRVHPTKIRIVLAVVSEAETAEECSLKVNGTIKLLKRAWSQIGIAPESIVEDFIAMLPVYEWKLVEKDAKEIGMEKKAGYRMQTNVHLSVPNDANAARPLTVAFEQGVTDIIAFDYWSEELDEFKTKAREQAIKAARSKADQLLGSLFDAVPPAINIQEQTTVRYPDSLYHSFVNVADNEITHAWRSDIAFIRANRPRNTYYRGLQADADVQARELPMRPEISVVSSVRIYYQSPAANQKNKTDAK